MERQDDPISPMPREIQAESTTETGPQLSASEGQLPSPGPLLQDRRRGPGEAWQELGRQLGQLQLSEEIQEDLEAGVVDRTLRPPRLSNLPPRELGGPSSSNSMMSPRMRIEEGPARGRVTRVALRGRGALSRGAVRMSLEEPIPSRSRREEMTPGRTIVFEDEDEEEEDERSSSTAHLSRLALERALRAEQIRRAQAERALKGRPSPRRESGYTEVSERGEERSHARPKLNKPRTFRGKYTEVYNVLNWLHQVHRYLMQCHCDPDDYTGYARTYMDETVQGWMDAEFADDDFPSWERFEKAMVDRWLPPDHDVRINLVFDRMQQRDTLQNYMESWQILDAALKFSGVHIEPIRKVMQFIKGLRDKDEKRYLLEKDPETLADVYRWVVRLRQSKFLTERLTSKGSRVPKTPRGGRRKRRDSDSSGSRSPRVKKYNRLEGKARQDAWDKGLCLGCGSPDHQIKACPKVKRAIRRMTKEYIAKQASKFSSSATAGSKKKRFHKLDSGKDEEKDDPPSQEEDKTETSESDEESDKSQSQDESSGNGSSEA